MNEKYYIPELEELHVGYQCEIREDLDDDTIYWESHIIVESDLHYLSNWITWGEIRTKYLDRQELKKEGWIDEDDLFFKLESDIKDRWYFSFYPKHNRIEFCDQENENGFAGTIKSINEFRNIVKYLGI